MATGTAAKPGLKDDPKTSQSPPHDILNTLNDLLATACPAQTPSQDLPAMDKTNEPRLVYHKRFSHERSKPWNQG